MTAVEANPILRNPAMSPVTIERLVRTDLETSVPNPNMVRGLVTPDMDHSDGTPGHRYRDMSVLQQHRSTPQWHRLSMGIVCWAKHGSHSGTHDAEGRKLRDSDKEEFSEEISEVAVQI